MPLYWRSGYQKMEFKKVSLFSGFKELYSLKKFIVFLIVTFLIFGPNLANNFYFGLFVDELGGSYSGIGGILALMGVLLNLWLMKDEQGLMSKAIALRKG